MTKLKILKRAPRCVLIAGPDGAGKTTFAFEYLPQEGRMNRFINADLIARGLSPLQPVLAAVPAGRLYLAEIDRFAHTRTDFAFEATLGDETFVPRLMRWKAIGYHIEIIYLQLASPQLALKRVAARVEQGGHDVPREDVLRLFGPSWDNFKASFSPLANLWAVFDNATEKPQLIELMKQTSVRSEPTPFAEGIEAALLRALKTARQAARIHGAELHFGPQGKAIASRS